jgi:hypothetical protein
MQENDETKDEGRTAWKHCVKLRELKLYILTQFREPMLACPAKVCVEKERPVMEIAGCASGLVLIRNRAISPISLQASGSHAATRQDELTAERLHGLVERPIAPPECSASFWAECGPNTRDGECM